jgi:hypothetical protein
MFQALLDAQTEPFHRVRLLAAAAAPSSLYALPISGCGLRLIDEAARVAVGPCLGTALFCMDIDVHAAPTSMNEAHTVCPANGTHAGHSGTVT